MSDRDKVELARERTKVALIARGVEVAEAAAIVATGQYRSTNDDEIIIDIGKFRAVSSQPATLAALAEQIASQPEGFRIPVSDADANAAARAAGLADAQEQRKALDTSLAFR